MARVRPGISQTRRTEEADAPAGKAERLLQAEREAHHLSKLALERELARSRWLEDKVLSVQDQERARLARDLHAGIAQNPVAVSLLLETHLRQLPESGPESGPMQSGLKLSKILEQTSRKCAAFPTG